MKEGARAKMEEWGRERERERVSRLILLTFRGGNLPKQKIFKFLR